MFATKLVALFEDKIINGLLLLFNVITLLSMEYIIFVHQFLTAEEEIEIRGMVKLQSIHYSKHFQKAWRFDFVCRTNKVLVLNVIWNDCEYFWELFDDHIFVQKTECLGTALKWRNTLSVQERLLYESRIEDDRLWNNIKRIRKTQLQTKQLLFTYEYCKNKSIKYFCLIWINIQGLTRKKTF